jgi:hypothetical protein
MRGRKSACTEFARISYHEVQSVEGKSAVSTALCSAVAAAVPHSSMRLRSKLLATAGTCAMLRLSCACMSAIVERAREVDTGKYHSLSRHLP